MQPRQSAKNVLRPFLGPLLRRLRLPFVVMLPRIEALEAWSGQIDILERSKVFETRCQQIDLLERRFNEVIASPPTAPAVRATLDNLVRTWLRLQNEVSRLASTVADLAPKAVETQIAEIATRLKTIEARALTAPATESEQSDARHRRVDDTLRFLLDRVEFVRREMMFELRYGAGPRGSNAASSDAVRQRILVPENVAAARASGLLRLNIGCGHIPMDGYVNVDARDLPGVDVIAEAADLPFERSSVDEIYSAHLVEHFPQEELKRRVLPYWHSVMKPGGILRAVTPDGEAMLTAFADGSYRFEDFREVLFGGQDYDGDFHYNLLTPDSFRDLVEAAGFVAVQIPVRGRRNGQCFEFELVARKPASGGDE